MYTAESLSAMRILELRVLAKEININRADQYRKHELVEKILSKLGLSTENEEQPVEEVRPKRGRKPKAVAPTQNERSEEPHV